MTKAKLSRLASLFDSFSCVGFKRGFVGHGAPTPDWPNGSPLFGLRTTGAFHGATEAWDYAARDPRDVFADIERRGDVWHLDVITNAHGAGSLDAWFSDRFDSFRAAYRALDWLARDDWAALRTKAPERNTARRLTDAERAELTTYANAA